MQLLHKLPNEQVIRLDIITSISGVDIDNSFGISRIQFSVYLDSGVIQIGEQGYSDEARANVESWRLELIEAWRISIEGDVKPTCLSAYRLKKDMPMLPAGSVFLHDPDDHVKGSIGCGCLKLAWFKHNCQNSWVAETHVLPGQCADDTEWFEKIKNNGEYHL